MTTKRLWIISIILGFITMFIGYQYFSSLEKKTEADIPWTNVVVATVDIAPTTKITDEMVEIKKMDSRYLPPNTISSIDEVVGKINRWRILQGEAILAPRLANPESQDTRLAYKIPEGYRAISIVYSPIVGVGGYIKPGDHVDVVGTYEEVTHNGKIELKISKTILQNVLVLAVGKEMIPEEEGVNGKPQDTQNVETVTLAVTLKEAERLTFTEEYGKVRLLLRPVLDKGVQSTSGATPENILNP